MKTYRFLILIVAVLMAGSLIACGKAKTPDAKPTETSGSGIPSDSILFFNDDAGSAELMQFFDSGKVPEEANILYDEMGSNPDITIIDPAIIKELYQRLSKITVSKESNTSITDSYHHIQFKLANDKYINYSFEGSDLWCYNSKNYDITDGGKLFGYMKELTEKALEQGSK